MSYEIYLPQTFQRCIRHLKKKFPRVKDDLLILFQNLQKDPQIGDSIPGWNRKVWKIRISSKDLKRAVGFEARMDMSFAYALPITVRLGIARALDYQCDTPYCDYTVIANAWFTL